MDEGLKGHASVVPPLKTADLADVSGEILPSSLDSWYGLREFETRDITSRSYLNRHSRDLKADKCREIAANFAQAREYFSSASLADHAVRPLLQYYGVASLSRGLVLYLSPHKRETELRAGHGLVPIDWKGVLNSDAPDYRALGVRTCSGLFKELLDAVAGTSYFRHGSHEVNVCIGAGSLSSDCEFALGEVAARIPDVSEQYAAWAGIRPPFMPIVSVEPNWQDHRSMVKLPKKLPDPISDSVPELSELGIEDLFPDGQCPNLTVDGSREHILVEYDPPFVPFIAQQVDHHGAGRMILYEPLGSRVYLNPLAACFVMSYILGMLCRYHPTTWVNLARSERGDAIYPFIVRASDWIQAMFPTMSLDILRGPYYFER